ncbi:hypothetical protein [Luteibacter aegosomatissinici]|uniref:hypothetical protein n=1 Tax=Luteibacter aegosomatissinici TaxID=2911539 RepID=UPI001FF8CE96|nr:hypothetical protein [Luteibacter aegosomatissinici]UPG92670.1 hypothetical protein L2Y97_12420 [Luteibacter aegosomatissinici]
MKAEPVTPAPSILDPVFDRASDTLRYAEHLLVKRVKVHSSEALVVMDSVWHVPGFLFLGLGLNTKRLVLTALMVPVWWLIFSAIALFDSALGHPSPGGLWWPAALMAMGTMVFRLPAGGALDGVKRTAVLLLAIFVRDRCPTEEGLVGVKSAIAALQPLAIARNARLQAVVGLLWGGLTWWVLTWVLGSSVAQATRNAAAGWAIVAGLFSSSSFLPGPAMRRRPGSFG